MADYNLSGGGTSLRDALNQLYPLTGLGNYSTQFPPQSGAEMPSGPVPMPQPRPPQAPGGGGIAGLLAGQGQGGGIAQMLAAQGLGGGAAGLLQGGAAGAPAVPGTGSDYAGPQLPAGVVPSGQPGRFPQRPPGAPPDYGALLQSLGRY